MAIGSLREKHYSTEKNEIDLLENVDTTFLNECFKKIEDDIKNEIREKRMLLFKLQVVKYGSIVSTLFCGISPCISESLNQRAEILTKVGVGFLGIAIFAHFCIVILKKCIKTGY